MRNICVRGDAEFSGSPSGYWARMCEAMRANYTKWHLYMQNSVGEDTRTHATRAIRGRGGGEASVSTYQYSTQTGEQQRVVVAIPPKCNQAADRVYI